MNHKGTWLYVLEILTCQPQFSCIKYPLLPTHIYIRPQLNMLHTDKPVKYCQPGTAWFTTVYTCYCYISEKLWQSESITENHSKSCTKQNMLQNSSLSISVWLARRKLSHNHYELLGHDPHVQTNIINNHIVSFQISLNFGMWTCPKGS